MFCVDKIKYEHLAILSNLKSCQFAPKIVIFNLCIFCQFENLQRQNNSYEPSQHLIVTIVTSSRIIVSDHILMWSSAEWVKTDIRAEQVCGTCGDIKTRALIACRGGSRIFIWGGGGQKIRTRTSRARSPKSLRPGPTYWPWKLSGFLMLSHAI